MNKQGTMICALLFCGMILSVSVLQCIHEITTRERIQALDILSDTFVAPQKRLEKIRDDLAGIVRRSDGIHRLYASGECTDSCYEAAESMLADAENARRHVIELNRHISDSLVPQLAGYDSLVATITMLRDAIDGEDSGAAETANSECSGLADRLLATVSTGGLMQWGGEVVHAFFAGTFFNDHYIRAYEKELEKRSVAANTIRPVMQFLRYRLLADPGEKAIAGKKGWLFYRPGVEYLYRPSVFDRRSKVTDFNDKPVLDDPLAAIIDFGDQLASRNIDLLVVIAPGKASVYPDYFTGPPRTCLRSDISQTGIFIDTLKHRGIDVVDLFTPFRRERCNDSLQGEKMYLERDTHWKCRGLLLAASTVAERIRGYQWYDDAHTDAYFSTDTLTVQRDGDVGVMTDLASNPFERLRVDFPLESTRCVKVMNEVRDENGTVKHRMPYKDDYKNSRILVLGDSFSRIYQTDAPGSAGFIAHLAADLSEPLASLVSDGGASTLVREKLVRNSGLLTGKRLVVWEFVERDIRFGAFGWKKVALP